MKKITFIVFLCLMSMGIQAQTTRYASPTGSTTVTGTDPAQPMELRLAINSTADGDTLLLEGTFTFADDTEIIFFQGRNNITVGSYGAGATIQRNTTAAASGISFIVLVDSTNMTIENINFTNNFGPNSRAIFMYGSGDNYTIQNNTFSNIGWSTDATASPIDATTGIASGANVIIALGNKNPTSSGIVNTNGEITNLNILNNTISNCITGTSESITVAGNVDGFLVENNTITDVTNIGIDAAGHFSFVQDFETGIFLNDINPELNQARNGVISGNTVANAVSSVAVSAGIYCDGCRDVVIKENLVTGSGTGFSIGCEVGGGNTAENVYLVNNIARDNLQSGMFLGSITSEGTTELSSVDNCVVRNNVFYNNNASGSTFFNTFSIALSKGNNNEISNNIIHLREDIEGTGIDGVGITVFDGVSPNITNYTITNNLFYKTSGAVISAAEQLNANGTALTIAGSVLADPAFLDVNNNLFEIPTTSAAADAGTAITLVANETDFDGDARIQGTSVDIGAQETATTTTSDPVATIYDISNFGGWSVDLSVGTYTRDQLVALGANDNDITSLKVADGYAITLYYDDNFAGNELVRTSDEDNLLPYNFGYHVSSLKVESLANSTPNVVSLFDISNYGNYFAALGVGSYTLSQLQALGINNDDITSLTVADGYKVTLYNHYNFTGDSLVRISDDANLIPEGFGAKISSIIIEEDNTVVGGVVTVFDLCNFSTTGGWGGIDLGVGSYTISDLAAYGIDNDDIQGFTIEDGYQITLYKHNNFQGYNLVSTSDVACLDSNLNDEVSSIVIEAVSSAKTNVIEKEEIAQQKLSAYPNPAKSTINISGLLEGQSVQIFNILGAKVLETTQSTINIDNLKAGMYFIRSEEQTVKFIKK